jgi:Cd2+/Zn2+-exporting ATPase
VADAIGKAAGVEEIDAELLPEEKVAAIEKMRSEGRRIIMVGDGVNDAPAMATASVGVAMGAAGTDVALEAADVVLMSSNLGKLVEAIELSQRARRVLYQNLLFASGVLVILVGFAASGWLPLPVGVVGHEGSTLIVVLSGLRLLAWRPRLGIAESDG